MEGQVMNQGMHARAIVYSILLMSSVLNANVLFAQESFRISRPSQAETDAAVASVAPVQTAIQSNFPTLNFKSQQPYDVTTGGASGGALKANATVNLEDQPSPQYHNAILDWQNRCLPGRVEEQNGGAAGDANIAHHKGFKSHLVGVLGGVAGTVASSYVPVMAVHPRPAPTIGITPGHCPAAFDPAFQVPVRWWDTLAREESSQVLGPEWKLWLSAVKLVFQAHARELLEAPQVASLHVMVNPDGSIYNVTPYTGAEGANFSHPVSERAMQNLRGIVLSVGSFPPFPQGTQVRCYHLIINASPGI
jgi:hypothetical protein